MRKQRRPSLRFIVATTTISLLMLFTPGFECLEQDGVIWEGRPEHGFYFLTLTPSTVVVSQGGTATTIVDFVSDDPNLATPPFFFDYETEGEPDGLEVRKQRGGDDPYSIGTYRIEHRIEAGTVAPGIYSVQVKAVELNQNPNDNAFQNVYAEKALTVVVTPRGIAGAPAAGQIACGEYHTLAILQGGSLWSWGLNHRGQLGDGTTNSRLTPVQIQGLPGATVGAAGGGSHTLALLDDETVWGWGDNSRGQLGLSTRGTAGPPKMTSEPVEVYSSQFNHPVAIAAGRNHSMLLTGNGRVFTNGANDKGQGGWGTSQSKWETGWREVELDAPIRFTAISAGGDFSAAIDDQGRVWGWGDNAYGQLGWDSVDLVSAPTPTGIFDAVAIAAGENHMLALKSDGTVTTIGSDSYGSPGGSSFGTLVPGLSGVVEIAAGFFHSLALTGDGVVYGWGGVGFGQLAIPQIDPSLPPGSPQLVTPLAPTSAIAAGGRHSLGIVTGCATLLSWGDNGAGQLGDGTGQSSSMPVQVVGIGEAGPSANCVVPLGVIVVGGGNVTSDPAGIDCGSSCSASFLPGTVVTLMAEPDPGWSFDRWAGDVEDTDRTASVLVDGSKICIAYFSSQPVPPTARFTVLPDYPLTTDTVVFDASESYDNGWIALYEWDFDNDGQFDVFRSRTSVDAVFSAEFVTNNWTAGTHTIKLRVTDNDGMSDETTGVIQVREPEPPRYDLGDAPDSSNTIPGQPPMIAYPNTGVIARYPTVFRAGSPPYGPMHRSPESYFYLGKDVTLENEADVGIDQDGTNNISPPLDSADRDGGDDGIQMPAALPYCGRANMECTITVVDPPHQYIYVNIWFDWNRDGDWDDVLECPDGSKVREHGVQNEEMYLYDSGTETLSFSFRCWHPSEAAASDPLWMRVTLSEQSWSGSTGGSGPAGGYEYGETEDYYIQQ